MRGGRSLLEGDVGGVQATASRSLERLVVRRARSFLAVGTLVLWRTPVSGRQQREQQVQRRRLPL
jgi:hypothetical protein